MEGLAPRDLRGAGGAAEAVEPEAAEVLAMSAIVTAHRRGTI